MKELFGIQTELKAPKGQYNKFGKYYYRNAEDILEALKPLLKAYKCSVNVSDEVVMLGDRFYIKATATIKNESGETESAVGFAREEESKKGMDAMQLSGATSSYARKYALNGLFAIDDNKDSDTTNKHGKDNPNTPPKPNVDKLIKDTKDSKELKAVAKQHWSIMTDSQKNAFRDKLLELNFDPYVRAVEADKITLDDLIKREGLGEKHKKQIVEQLTKNAENEK